MALCLQAIFPGLGLFETQGGHGIEAVGAQGGDVACVKPFPFRRGDTSNEIRKGTLLNRLTRNRKSN